MRLCLSSLPLLTLHPPQPQTLFKVEISYFEIYSERIYDLLAPTSKGGRMQQLRVREHPSLGPFVMNLTTYAALSAADIYGAA